MQFIRASDFIKKKERNPNDKVIWLVMCFVCTKIAPRYQTEFNNLRDELGREREEWEPMPESDNIDNYDVIEKWFMKYIPEIDLYRCPKCKNEVHYDEVKKRIYYNEGKYILNDTPVDTQKIRSIADYSQVEKQGISNIEDPNFNIKKQRSVLFPDNEHEEDYYQG